MTPPMDEDRPLITRPDQTDPATRKDNHRRESICTFTGLEFFPLDPRAADVRVEDLAHATAQKVRYTGHCRFFYSVAQHGVFVQEILARLGESIEVQLLGLMHDTTEAYLPDVASPIKGSIQGFRDIEAKVWLAIAEAFGLPEKMPKVVKAADAEAFRHERPQLLPRVDWWNETPPELAHEDLTSWTPEYAKSVWLDRFDFLNEAWLTQRGKL